MNIFPSKRAEGFDYLGYVCHEQKLKELESIDKLQGWLVCLAANEIKWASE